MAYNMRGKRVAHDNIAAGSATGWENHISGSSQSSMSSQYGNPREAGGFSNISAGNLPGVEDTDNGTADKLTTDGEEL